MSSVFSLPRLGVGSRGMSRRLSAVCTFEASEAKIRVNKTSSRRDGISRASFCRAVAHFKSIEGHGDACWITRLPAPLSLGRVAQNGCQNLQISVRWRCVETENLRDQRIDVHVFKCRNSRIRPNVRTHGIKNGTHALELLRG